MTNLYSKTRFFVTLSKSGHYTVTLKGQTAERAHWVFISRAEKLASLSHVEMAKADLLAALAAK